MKINLVATCLITATLLTPFAAHATDSDSDRSHPMTFVKDSAITAEIKAKLAEEKISSLIHIKVDTTSKGAVVLSGTVKTRKEAERAISIARGTKGVISVKNNIKIMKTN